MQRAVTPDCLVSALILLPAPVARTLGLGGNLTLLPGHPTHKQTARTREGQGCRKTSWITMNTCSSFPLSGVYPRGVLGGCCHPARCHSGVLRLPQEPVLRPRTPSWLGLSTQGFSPFSSDVSLRMRFYTSGFDVNFFWWHKLVPALTSFAGAGCAASLAGCTDQWHKVACCKA